MAMNAIYTIGYEGATLEDFIATLKGKGVKVLIDIRELPMSRRRGFSKSALSQAAEEAGLSYRHEKALGSPRDIRNQLRADGDYKTYFQAFDRYLKTQSDLLEELARSVKGSAVLMCYERDPLICHRRSVARALGEILDRKPHHLGVDKDGHGRERTNKSMHSR